METLAFLGMLVVIYGIAGLAPTSLVIGDRPTERRREWPAGVQEGDPRRYAVELMAPRQPPERVEPVATERVESHFTMRRG